MNSTDDGIENDAGAPVRPAYQLFSIGAVSWATFFGSPLAGGIVLSINYQRLGQRVSRLHALLWSAIGTIGMFAAAFLIPDSWPIPDAVYAAMPPAVMYGCASSLQGGVIELHVRRGGVLASNWRAVGIGVICGLGILVMLVGAFVSWVLLDTGQVIEFNQNDDVYYSGDATADDAQFLGETLTEVGWFGSSHGVSAGIESTNGEIAIYFVVRDGAWDDRDLVDVLTQIGEVVARKRFGRPLTIHLCDDSWEARESVVIQ